MTDSLELTNVVVEYTLQRVYLLKCSSVVFVQQNHKKYTFSSSQVSVMAAGACHDHNKLDVGCWRDATMGMYLCARPMLDNSKMQL